jgi:hypothetical protein
MTVTIETSGVQELEQLLLMLKSLNIKSIKIQETPVASRPVITRGDKSLDPKALFGIWEHNPRTLEQIRSTAWKRNWNI